MRHHKAGRKLSPELKAVTDPIFKRDPERYKNLIRWVWWYQSHGASDESIINCLLMADNYNGVMSKNRLDLVTDWWSYLTKLMPKASGKAHEQESNDYKAEEKRFLDKILEHCRPK